MEMIGSQEAKRRGNKQENIPAKYYCPKCDHFDYDNPSTNK